MFVVVGNNVSSLSIEVSACSLSCALIFSICVSSFSLFCALCFELITRKTFLYRCEFGVLKIGYGEATWNCMRGQQKVITIDLTKGSYHLCQAQE